MWKNDVFKCKFSIVVINLKNRMRGKILTQPRIIENYWNNIYGITVR